jgi:hypothetical protein
MAMSAKGRANISKGMKAAHALKRARREREEREAANEQSIPLDAIPARRLPAKRGRKRLPDVTPINGSGGARVAQARVVCFIGTPADLKDLLKGLL